MALSTCFTRPIDYRLPQLGYLLIALGLGIVILPWTPLLPYTTYILAFIFGMQNALPIQWQGVLVRSTHFTGYLTDLSRLLADRSHRTHQGPALALYLGSLASFVGGAALMSTCFYRFELDLASLGWLYTSTGISYLGLCLMARRYNH